MSDSHRQHSTHQRLTFIRFRQLSAHRMTVHNHNDFRFIFDNSLTVNISLFFRRRHRRHRHLLLRCHFGHTHALSLSSIENPLLRKLNVSRLFDDLSSHDPFPFRCIKYAFDCCSLIFSSVIVKCQFALFTHANQQLILNQSVRIT